MHYFQFEIKEWISNTAHLELEEEAAYLRLIFYYYDSEKPIDANELEKVFRRCRIPFDLGTYILTEYFQCENEMFWHHKRCDQEIAKYHAKHEQASKAGRASAQARFNGRSTGVQPIINHKSLIINQESNIKAKVSPLAPKVAIPLGVSEIIWNDYLILRKSKKLTLTQTALNGILRESKKVNKTLEEVLTICCERGWVGFKAEWLDQNPKRFSTPLEITVPSKQGVDPTILKIIADGLKSKPPSDEIKQKIAELRKKA